MSRLNRLETSKNCAHSGAGVKNYRDGYLKSECLIDTDCYFICLGVNDLSSSNKVEVGTPNDIKENYEENATTFYGDYD